MRPTVPPGFRRVALCLSLATLPLLRPDPLPAQSGATLRPGKYPGSVKITQTDEGGGVQTASASLELNVVSVSPSGEVVASMMAYNGAYGGGDLRGKVEPDGSLRLSGTVLMRPTTVEARVSVPGEVTGRYSLGDAWPRVVGEFALACSTCAPAASAPPPPGRPVPPPPTPARPSAPAASAVPSAPAAPAAGGMKTAGLVGTWSLSLPGAVSITDSRQRVDAQTVEKTSKVTITTGQAGMGSLTIRGNGTYRLVWDSKTTTGRWDHAPAGGPFVGSIRLLDAHPHKHWDDRNWYVFVKDDGEKEARFPPHTGYDAVRLRAPK